MAATEFGMGVSAQKDGFCYRSCRRYSCLDKLNVLSKGKRRTVRQKSSQRAAREGRKFRRGENIP